MVYHPHFDLAMAIFDSDTNAQPMRLSTHAKRASTTARAALIFAEA